MSEATQKTMGRRMHLMPPLDRWPEDQPPPVEDREKYFADVRRINESLIGLLVVNRYERTNDPDDGWDGLAYVGPWDSRSEEEDRPVVDFNPEYGEFIQSHGNDVAKAVVTHLQNVIEEHQAHLTAVVERLRGDGLLD